MSGMSELDQVADARRKVASHAQFPTGYWVFFGVALVFMAGVPIWMSWVNSAGSTYLGWSLGAIALGSAVYSVIKRRRSGVHLPKWAGAYPSARPIWLASIVITLAGFVGINVLVNNDQRNIALMVLPVVAIAVFFTHLKIRSAMRRDIEAGRVRP
ncbi:hypothetical protein [Prauserella cavernicola]|uniref:Uncharacterized protein n=1 Tax=Prauserella cavernicola TaxID=2800127 RepID=A0A934QR84_9PSEU|nr:hypothetical protein [Prauserella cavernicola]MBK1785226.1 hypothetical protein [Prauserella cavernicola]